ncbi:MAG TPA: hypothetical protein VFC93_05195, partial [Chloroflexota bacterium]|nr:hypothetical protein [Chloroflexota bacterium]
MSNRLSRRAALLPLLLLVVAVCGRAEAGVGYRLYLPVAASDAGRSALIVSLTPDRPSPQPASTTVTWTAATPDDVNRRLEWATGGRDRHREWAASP